MALVKVGGVSNHPAPNGLTSTATWNGLERGDKVRVRGRHGTFSFYEHTCNDLGHEWVTVYGTQFVSVAPDAIRKA